MSGGVLAVIIGRAASKGLPGKNARQLAGLPMIAHTIAHAYASSCVRKTIVTTDGAEIAASARRMGCQVIERPAHLAGDSASVQNAAAHAVSALGAADDLVAILYANVPVRPGDLIDRAVDLLLRTNADSVQSYAPVGKNHPSWMVTLDDAGSVRRLDPTVIHRRQDLAECFIPDGGVIVCPRGRLLEADPQNPHSFLGERRFGIRTDEGDVIDIDREADLLAAEARLALERRARARPFLIDGRLIDRTQPPYIIAEIGVNHDGDSARLLELVDAAADAGADAVKTQFFRSDLLMGKAAELAEYQRRSGAKDAAEMILALELSRDDLAAFVHRARARGVAPILTIFSTQLVGEAEDLGFAAWKTASPDVIHLPLLSRLAETGLPLLVSTGAAEPEEIALAHMHLRGASCAFLQCVSAYPAENESAALGGIGAIAALTGDPAGYSDHTTSVSTGALAVIAGASILEKHFTWSRTAAGPDHAASLDPSGFAAYVAAAHGAHAAIGSGDKRVLAVEQEVRRISRQSVTAAGALPAGHRIKEGDLMICRPGTGLPPGHLKELIGRVLARDIAAGMPLRERDLS